MFINDVEKNYLLHVSEKVKIISVAPTYRKYLQRLHVQAPDQFHHASFLFLYLTGVYFTKYCRDLCLQLGIGGWVKNSKTGTIVGKMQGEKSKIEQM
jgi:hypothetical protein